MDSDVILVIVVATALAFDFTNGFHDTANAVATMISTRALPPRVAVGIASVLNFAGAFISLAVAATVANGIVQADLITTTIVFAGLVGAIAWNLATWYFGLPSSSSHALIGGVVGAAFAAEGSQAIQVDGLVEKVLIPAVIAPILAFVVAAIAIVIAYRIVGRLRPGPVNRGYRLGQLVSGGMLALSHGTNDAQKTMGIITLALVAHGNISESHFYIPDWVVVSSASAIALGTYVGGWRIIRTMGFRIIKMDPAQGFVPRAQARRPSSRPRISATRCPRRRRSPAASWAPGRASDSPPCAGEWPATSSAPGCSRSPRRPWSARRRTASRASSALARSARSSWPSRFSRSSPRRSPAGSRRAGR